MDGEMMIFYRQCVLSSILAFSLLFVAGCGSSESNQPTSKTSSEAPPAGVTTNSTANTDTNSNLTTAAIPNNSAKPEEPKKEVDPLILKLRNIKATIRQPFPETKDPKELAGLKLERYKNVIDQIMPIIAKTLADPEKEEIFVESIRLMIDTRLKAALLGDQDEIEALYADAESMYKNSQKSSAAARAAPDAGLAVVRFAHAITRKDSKKIPEFTKQARVFATRFPNKKLYTVPLLYSAAWSAELHQMRDEAIHCYTMIRDDFPETLQANQSTAILRRLTLPGKSAQLSGSTIDGGLWNLDDHKGKVVMVVFWDSQTEQFKKIAPEIVKISNQYSKSGLHTVGINLDKQEAEANNLVEKFKIDWPQVFFPEQNKRRWNNPMVVYYGVRDIPLIWLIDENGIVTNTNVKITDLNKEVRSLLIKRQKNK